MTTSVKDHGAGLRGVSTLSDCMLQHGDEVKLPSVLVQVDVLKGACEKHRPDTGCTQITGCVQGSGIIQHVQRFILATVWSVVSL